MFDFPLIIATNNKNKVKEIKEILSGHFSDILSMAEAGIAIDIVEDGATFIENALIKAKAIRALKPDFAVLADDSGLCVDALGGEPGIRSARYSGEGANDQKNNELLLKNMQGVKNRNAKFMCAIALILADGTQIVSQGESLGEIMHEAKGENGFGYDPLFFSYDLNKPFAQASSEEKNSVSHRGRALASLLDKLIEGK